MRKQGPEEDYAIIKKNHRRTLFSCLKLIAHRLGDKKILGNTKVVCSDCASFFIYKYIHRSIHGCMSWCSLGGGKWLLHSRGLSFECKIESGDPVYTCCPACLASFGERSSDVGGRQKTAVFRFDVQWLEKA